SKPVVPAVTQQALGPAECRVPRPDTPGCWAAPVEQLPKLLERHITRDGDALDQAPGSRGAVVAWLRSEHGTISALSSCLELALASAAARKGKQGHLATNRLLQEIPALRQLALQRSRRQRIQEAMADTMG